MLSKMKRIWVKLVRFGFQLLYNQFAWSYDAVSWLVSFGVWRDWQRAALPYVQGPHVLEIGHGPGHMLLALKNAGYKTVGIDLSKQMGALSQSRLRKANASALLLRGASQNLPFRARLFDSVLVTFPSDFVTADETLAAVHRVLKPNGRFIIVPEARFTSRRMPERIVELLYLITGQRNQDKYSHAARWNSLKQQFSISGFYFDSHTINLEQSQVTVLLATKRELAEKAG